jgi:hypothetical protein
VRQAIRSTLAVLLGLATSVAVFLAIGELLVRATTSGAVHWHGPTRYTVAGLATHLFQLLISVAVGGFVAAWLARRAALRHATAVAMCLLTPAVFVDGIPDAYFQPVWYSVLSLLLVIPAGVLGGYIASRTRSDARQIRYGV